MNRVRSYKYRIYPNKEQTILIEKTFGCCRFVWNRMLEDKEKEYKETGRTPFVTPAMYKQKYPWLNEVDSMALCNVQIYLENAYKLFFNNMKTVGFPKFKKKCSFQSYTTNYKKDRNNIRFMNNYIHLPKLDYVRIKRHRNIPENFQIKQAIITRTPLHKYYVCIIVECNEEIVNSNLCLENSIGLDYSSAKFYVDNNGDSPLENHYYKKSENKLKIEQRKLSHMVLNSNNYKKQLLKVNRVHEKIKNQRNDYLHKLSYEIAEKYDFVFVEDINLLDMSQTLDSLGKPTMDNGFGTFRCYLSYKMQDRGKVIMNVNRYFPSSKKCHVCGSTNHDLTVDDRKWKCPICNSEHDRDINAAINIRNEGIRIVKNNLGVQGDSLLNLNSLEFLSKKTNCYTTTVDCGSAL